MGAMICRKGTIAHDFAGKYTSRLKLAGNPVCPITKSAGALDHHEEVGLVTPYIHRQHAELPLGRRDQPRYGGGL